MAIRFQDSFHTGFFAPLRFEADIHDCEVDGQMPIDLDGSFYRTCIDRHYPQRLPNDIPYNADGAVDLFRFRDGHVDFRTRYIRTPRYVAERAARRALFGVYRNHYTNDPERRRHVHEYGQYDAAGPRGKALLPEGKQSAHAGRSAFAEDAWANTTSRDGSRHKRLPRIPRSIRSAAR